MSIIQLRKDELLTLIIKGNLHPRGLQALCSTSRKFSQFCEENSVQIWRIYLQRYFPNFFIFQTLPNPKEIWTSITTGYIPFFFSLKKEREDEQTNLYWDRYQVKSGEVMLSNYSKTGNRIGRRNEIIFWSKPEMIRSSKKEYYDICGFIDSPEVFIYNEVNITDELKRIMINILRNYPEAETIRIIKKTSQPGQRFKLGYIKVLDIDEYDVLFRDLYGFNGILTLDICTSEEICDTIELVHFAGVSIVSTSIDITSFQKLVDIPDY